MPSPNLREIGRDALYRVFKEEQLVRLFEEILFTLNETLPGDTTAVEAALTAHVADTADAHQASAIGATPTGGLASNTVAGQLAELEAEKEATGTAAAAVAAHVAAADPHTQYATDAALAAGLAGKQDADPELTAWAGKTAPTGDVVGTTDQQTLTKKTLGAENFFEQAAPTTKSGAATLTGAELLTRIVEYTGAAAALTLPTALGLAGAVTAFPIDAAIEFSVVNTGSGTATVTASASISVVGSGAVAAGTSGLFRVRRDGLTSCIAYRIA